MEKRYQELARQLRSDLGVEQVATDLFRTTAWGADASFYRMTPKVVVTTTSEADVKAVLERCREHEAPVTFRAAGTSLSGQAVTDSVLARLGDGWQGVEVLEDGGAVRLGPGVIGARANQALSSYGRKLGPDPASINAAMVGGIAANNASGMCCGTDQNSYRTLRSMRVILADGTLLDTGDSASVARFRDSHPEVMAGLAALREDCLADPDLAARIRRKFSIKNTTGYSLNALVDFEDPIEILQHLMIGSEGTLGFISEIVYETVEDPRFKSAALAFYDHPAAAAAVVSSLKDAPVAAVELIDRAGIRSAQGKPGMPDFLSDLGPQATALLIEVQADSEEALESRVSATRQSLEPHPALQPIVFSSEPAVCAAYWAVRKGLFPSVGALRPTGSTVIIEDIAFPVEHLAEGITDLQALFQRHGYDDAILFGHARDGNLHIVFSQDFRHREETDRYARFMQEFCKLVVERYDGSLKAEHGTGRNVAPFVELEWGRDALMLMRRIKDLLDPTGLLNPEVVINDDPEAHLRCLKDLPAADPIIDKCTECGFCESRCPSHLLTTSPRQRTVAWRFLQSEGAEADVAEALARDFDYQALDTCAACGLCATVCPVQINTGEFVKAQRAQHHRARDDGWASWVADHFGVVSDAAGLGLRAGSLARALFGSTATEVMSSGAHAVSAGNIPKWSRTVPGGYSFRPDHTVEGASTDTQDDLYVYLPSCTSRHMRPVGEDGYHDPLPAVVERLAAMAGVSLVYPKGLNDLCCGQPFDSKGFSRQGDAKAHQAIEAVRAAGARSNVKLLSDTSPCSYRLESLGQTQVEVVDLVGFLHDVVLPRVELKPRSRKLAVHATCSIRKMGLTQKLGALAATCADITVTPPDVECCGFAGDRGFTHPELNAHALRHLKSALNGAEAGCSASVTCEIGLARYGGVPYRSIAYFVEEAAMQVHHDEEGGLETRGSDRSVDGTA